jgi:hypothetical protein
LPQSGEQLIVICLLTGLATGFAASTAFPIAAELMPAHHRRTYGAIYEMMLASSLRRTQCMRANFVSTPMPSNGETERGTAELAEARN